MSEHPDKILFASSLGATQHFSSPKAMEGANVIEDALTRANPGIAAALGPTSLTHKIAALVVF